MQPEMSMTTADSLNSFFPTMMPFLLKVYNRAGNSQGQWAGIVLHLHNGPALGRVHTQHLLHVPQLHHRLLSIPRVLGQHQHHLARGCKLGTDVGPPKVCRGHALCHLTYCIIGHWRHSTQLPAVTTGRLVHVSSFECSKKRLVFSFSRIWLIFTDYPNTYKYLP